MVVGKSEADERERRKSQSGLGKGEGKALRGEMIYKAGEEKEEAKE